jgi:hypothetical protein
MTDEAITKKLGKPKAPTPPRGLAAFAMRLGPAAAEKSVEQLATRAMSARIKHVYLCAEAEDGWTSPLELLQQWGRVFAEHGIAAHPYSFWGELASATPEPSADRLLAAVDALESSACVADVERAFRNVAKRRPLDALMSRLDAGASVRGVALGVCSYPVAEFHSPIGWKALRRGAYGVPMVYATAGDRSMSRKGVVGYREGWPELTNSPRLSRPVTPALALFETPSPGEGAGQLGGDIQRVCVDPAGRYDVDGVALWSLQQLGRDEARVLADVAARRGW